MLLPIGDSPNPTTTPWVTRLLVVANAAIFVFVNLSLAESIPQSAWQSDPMLIERIAEMWRAHGQPGHSIAEFALSLTYFDLFAFEHGYKAGSPSVSDLFTCMFLHANIMHLFGNMLFLWIFGDNVEARLGKAGYLVAYLGAGIAATVAYASLDSGSQTPLIGASGAISGILGFYLIWFPKNRVHIFYWFFIIFDVVSIPATWALLFYIVVDNLLPFALGTGGNVAHGAHIGGFVLGVGAAIVLDPKLRRSPEKQMGQSSPPQYSPGSIDLEGSGLTATQAFEGAIRDGRMNDAHTYFRPLAERRAPLPASLAALTYARWAYEYANPDTAYHALKFFAANYPRQRELPDIHLAIGILLARDLQRPVGAREHFLIALDLTEPGTETHRRAQEALRRL